jgi:hypothetical protein
MTNRGMLIGVALLATLAIAAMAAVLWAETADATITGKQLPPYGNDWVIDRDTSALSENINLQGEIKVMDGYKLYFKSVTLTFSSSHPGEHGIDLQSGGELEMTEVSIKAESTTSSNGWFFTVNGSLNIHDNVKLVNVQDGIDIATDEAVTIDDLELYAQGEYGIYIDACDPEITNTGIYLDATDGQGYGMYLYGDSGDLATPTLDNIYIKVNHTDEWERSSGYEWEYFNLYGLYAEGADLGTLSNIEITFDETVKATFDYTGSPYLFVFFNAYGIYLTGETTFDGFDNVRIVDGNYLADAKGTGEVNGGRITLYPSFYGLINEIWGSGSSPSKLSGLTISNHKASSNGNNVFPNIDTYPQGTAISWSPSTSSSSSLMFKGLTISECELNMVFEVRDSWSLTIDTCTITANDLNNGIIDTSWWSSSAAFSNNIIDDNDMDNGQYFRAEYMRGTFTLDNNEIANNTYNQMFYSQSNQNTITITDNYFWNNKESLTGSYVFFHIEYPSAKVYIESNNFTGNSFRQFLFCYNMGQTISFQNNELTQNTGTDYLFNLPYLNSDFTFKENTLINNTLNGGIMAYNNYRAVTINHNKLILNHMGTKPFLDTYGSNQAGFEVTENLIESNDMGGSMFDFVGLGYWKSGGVSLTIEQNDFINNSGSSAMNGGLIYFRYVKQDYTVQNNYFRDNTASCIVTYMSYVNGYDYGSWSYGDHHMTYWFYVEKNVFVNNSGKCIAFSEIDNNNIVIRQNKATGCSDYPVYIMAATAGYYYNQYYSYSPYYVYLYIWTEYPNGPDTIRIENNNISGNPGGGIWVDANYWDSNYYYSGNPSQEISVKNNFLEHNGKDGWAIWLSDIYKKPAMKANSIVGSAMGQYLGLIDDTSRRTEFAMEYRGLVMDGGKEGKTAFGFGDIEATFTECTLLNYTECFYAKDCTINAWWCAVPEGGGRTDGKGRIYVWNHLEIWVTWANATGVDSGVPVKHAIVSLRGHNGKYSGALITDEVGRLAPMIINPWTCIEGEMDMWSPYNATLLADNASTAHDVHVVGDFLAPNVMTLTLWDLYIPEVIISNPQDGTLLATEDVLGEGFLFERASGMDIFEAQTEMDPGTWEPVTPNVLWQHVFMGLTEGPHQLSVRAKDRSGNWNQSTVSIIVDMTDPTIAAHLEFLDGRVIPYDAVKGGYYVRDKEILINGTYSDNFAALRDIIIRINGVPEVIFQSQLGKIYKRIKLDQGINTLIIDATDTAGRRTEVRLYVSLDSYAPTLYLYSPLQNERTGNGTMMVTGLTEPKTTIDVLIQATAGTRTYTAMSGLDGMFAIEVELFESIQKVLVTATDSANNPTQLSRDVTLDTEAPDFVINQPPRSPITTKETKYTIVCTMTADPNADAFIGGQKVPNTGVFRRTLVLQEGVNTIEIRVVDKVGNEKVKSVVIYRDTVKPVLNVLTPIGDYLLTRDAIIRFTGTSQGADKVGGGVFVVHKGTSFPAVLLTGDWAGKATWKYDLTLGPNDFDQFIDVKAVDIAGNEVVRTIQVVYDIIPPVLSIASPNPTTLATKVPRVNINGSTDESILTVYLNGIEFPVKDGLFTVVWPLTAGLNTIDIKVQDEAGNNVTQSLKVTYTPPPPIKETEPPGPGTSNIWGWILIVAAATIVVTAFIITSGRAGRR